MPRANWHLDVPFDQSDPFAAPDVVDRVDLTDPEQLERRLVELLEREGELTEQQVTCPIKDRADSCCSACPLRGGYAAYRIRELCKVGVEQERTLMSMLAADA